MQQFVQSAFLEALGKAIASGIWQMGLLFLLYQVFIFIFTIKNAAVKNLLSSAFSLGGFAWFIGTVFFFWNKQTTASLVIEDGTVNQNLLRSFTNDNLWQILLNWTEYKLNFILPYLSVAYLFVLVWFTAKLSFQLHAANSLRTKGITAAGDDVNDFFTFLLQSMGLSKHVQLFISNQIDIPATLGFLKPVVLLPAAAVTHLTPAQLEAVLLHELSHIKRNDYFWNLLLSVAETLLFFNPFALLLIGIARRERENCCDDMVMAFQQNAAVYAEALLNVEKARWNNPKLAMALGDSKHHLMHRVKRILNLPAEKNRISTRLLALLFFTLVFTLMGWMIKGKQEQQLTLSQDRIRTSPHQPATVFLSPDALIQKEDKLVTLRDEKRNLHLEIRKEQDENKFLLRDKDGDQTKFDAIIFNESPAELLEHIIQPNDLTDTELYAKIQQPAYELKHDSSFYYRYETEEKDNLLKAMRQNNQNSIFVRLPQKRLLARLPNMDIINNEVFKNFTEFGTNTFIFNEYFKGFTTKDKADVNEWKEAQEKTVKEIRLKYKTQQLHKKARLLDSARQRRNYRAYADNSEFAYSYVFPDNVDHNMHNGETINIVVENKMVVINRKPVHLADSIACEQQRFHQPKRIIKRLEIIRL